jgi:hypothetical protein
LATNFAVLLTWTLAAPLEWTRVCKEATDPFGRPIESYGSCANADALPYCIVVLLLNLGFLLLANWWAYEARNIETEYHESRYIAISMASVLQAWCMGMPILIVVWDNPQAKFFVGTGIVFVTSLAVLALIFVPKVLAIREDYRLAEAEEKRRAYLGYSERKSQCFDVDDHKKESAVEKPAPSESFTAVAEETKEDEIGDTSIVGHDTLEKLPALKESSFLEMNERPGLGEKTQATSVRDVLGSLMFSPMAVKASEIEPQIGGIKVLHNPRSQRNLQMAKGRELSRAQLANLQRFSGAGSTPPDDQGASSTVLPTHDQDEHSPSKADQDEIS